MTFAIITSAVVVAWLVVVTFALHERGRVFRTPFGLLIVRIRRVEFEIGERLLPVLRKTAKAMSEWAEADA